MHFTFKSSDAPRVRCPAESSHVYDFGALPPRRDDEQLTQDLAGDMLALNAAAGGATRDALLALGKYTGAELERLGPEAARRARGDFVRIIERPAYDRQKRLADAVAIVMAVPPEDTAWWRALRDHAFPTTEIAELWDDLRRAVAEKLAGLACPQVS